MRSDGCIYGLGIDSEDELEIQIGVTLINAACRRTGDWIDGKPRALPKDECCQAAADFFRRRLALRERPAGE